MGVPACGGQVYGVRDKLFLPNFAAKAGLLRVFGDGNNVISFTAADNCAHAMILASSRLAQEGVNGAVSGSFYIVTDGGEIIWRRSPAPLWVPRTCKAGANATANPIGEFVS